MQKKIIIFIFFIFILFKFYLKYIENFEDKKFAIILRGHVRDTFENSKLKDFILYLINEKKMNIDIYIGTWSNIECKKNTSWRNINEKKELITEDKIKKYFSDEISNKYVKVIKIIDEKEIELVGDIEGKIYSTMMSKKGWKNMWYGKYLISNIVYNSDLNYDSILNLRIDFFSPSHSKRHIGDFKREITFDAIYNLMLNYNNNDKLIFLNNYPSTGIDNLYIGNKFTILKIADLFHNNLDMILHDFKEDINHNHEKLVYVVSKKLL